MAEEGHKVKLYIKDHHFKYAGIGIVDRVPSWRPHINSADLVIGDMVGFGYLEANLKRRGKPYIGISKLADMMELDRNKGMQLFEKFKIGIPKTYEYATPKEAADAVHYFGPSGMVIKPNGNADTGKTYVCKDIETYQWALTQYPADTSMIVQEVVNGIEVSTEGWFNGRDWVSPFNHTFEEKRVFPGGLGGNTGCMGNVVITTEGNRLTKETVEKLTPFLKKTGYRGPLDINAIVNEEGIFALEATPRLGYDAIEALLDGMKTPVADFFFKIANGTLEKADVTRDYMIAVRVSVPPAPYGKPDTSDRGKPIVGINKDNLKHLYLTDVYKEDNKYLYAAGDGVILKATAYGRTIDEARQRVYTTLKHISIMDMQYRKDIGMRVKPELKQLFDWGYLNG